MRANSYGIGAMYAVQFMTINIGELERTAPGGVDMEVNIMFGGDISHIVQWIYRTGFRCPGNTDQSNDILTVAMHLVNGRFQVCHGNFQIALLRNVTNIVFSDAEQRSYFSHG